MSYQDSSSSGTAIRIQEQHQEETRPLLSLPWQSTLDRSSNSTRTTTTLRLLALGIRRETLGLFIMLLASLAHASHSVFVKWCSLTFPALQIIFARSLLQTLFGVLGCCLLGVKPSGPSGVRRWVALRGFFGALSVVCLYYSMPYLSLAEVTVIIYLYPSMTGILAALFLGEPYGWLEASSAALCMVGAALVSKPYILFGDSDGTPGEKTPTHDGQHEEINHSTTTLATCIVFLSAITASFTYTIVRKVGTKSHFLTLAVSTGYMMCFVSFPAVLFGIQDFVMPTSYKDYLLLLSVGFVAFIYQCLANLGVQLAPAGPATLMCMNDIVFAFIFGICFFDEYPDVLSVLGALLIMTMTSIVAVNKWKKN